MTNPLHSLRARWILGVAVLSVIAVIGLTWHGTPPRTNLPPPPQPPASSTQSSVSTQPPVSTQTFSLTDIEIDRLKKQAGSGSGAAAYRLALYYETVRHDVAEAKRWMKTSAENGDVGGMYGYASYLRGSNDPGDRATARTWLEKVAAKGDDVSKSVARRDLRELDSAQKSDK